MKLNFKNAAFALTLAAMFTACSGSDSSSSQKKTDSSADDLCVQIYSIRELIGDSATYAANHDTVFTQLSRMGYASVEPAYYINRKFYGVSPEQFKADLAVAGLTALSSHATRSLTPEEIASHNFDDAMRWWDDAIADHKAAGMSYIVTPWSPMPASLDEAKTLCDYHNAVGQKCREAGIKYGYHTHSDEFNVIPGTDKVWMEYLVENTDPENMFWQLDTYLAVMAGASPVEYINKYPGRFALLHIKDKYELGTSGMVDLEPIIRAARDSGLDYLVIEQGNSDGSMPILQSMAQDADYLTKLLARMDAE